jgi:hypothetical protein
MVEKEGLLMGKTKGVYYCTNDKLEKVSESIWLKLSELERRLAVAESRVARAELIADRLEARSFDIRQ